jgi:L-ascorbate metabolism protein UlaG (beta-lactamase superfamily)
VARRSARLRLSDALRLRLLYEDATEYGSAVTSQCDATVRQACAAIVAARKQDGLPSVVARSTELLAAALTSGGLGELYERPGVLRPACLYPPPEQVRPVALQVERAAGEVVATVALSPPLVAELAQWTGEWYRGARVPSGGPARALWDALASADVLVPVASAPEPPRGDATFVGHATVALHSPSARLLFDPFLFPPSPRYAATYQPLTARALGPLDAVFVSHSHPDHFDVGSLLCLGAETPIYVPAVERESLLAVDMVWRLRELGFRRVQVLRWYDAVQVGQCRVTALPFYGEQPTTGTRYHPEARNAGNLYLVEDGERRYALAVDAGQDEAGDVKRLAAEARRRYGPLDALWGGYRAFAVYPIHYVFSSVARFLLFVPPEQWAVRQHMMNDATDLLDAAELWSARSVIPYADGGAPWYWELGLGPRLDGSGRVNPAVDPRPEVVASAAAARSASGEALIPSPVRVTLLRPGDSFKLQGGETRVLRRRPHAWPYPE